MEYGYNSSIIQIRDANENDADAIAQMYRDIAVTARNYREALDRDNGTFGHRGGMFEISDARMIRQRIADKNESVLIADVDNEPVSMLWFGLAGPEHFRNITPFPGCEERVARVNRKMNENRLGCAKEIVSLNAHCSHILPYLLNLEMIHAFLDRSIEDLILEIYRVDGYTDSTGHHRSDLFNHASAGVIEHNGGVRIGYTPQKHVTVDCFTVQITPVIYLLNCEHSWNIIMDLLMGKGRFYDA